MGFINPFAAEDAYTRVQVGKAETPGTTTDMTIVDWNYVKIFDDDDVCVCVCVRVNNLHTNSKTPSLF